MKPEKPEACPWCKSEDVTVQIGRDLTPPTKYAQCGECGARGPSRKTPADAVAAWNSRPRDDTNKEHP